MSYEPMHLCLELGIPVERMMLQATWGAWIPRYQVVILAEGLSPILERCVLAHSLEHVLAHDTAGCGVGPYADRVDVRNRFSWLTLQQERSADRQAARKLVDLHELMELTQWGVGDIHVVADKLRVTENMLRIRLDDMPGEGWPWLQGTSRIAG